MCKHLLRMMTPFLKLAHQFIYATRDPAKLNRSHVRCTVIQSDSSDIPPRYRCGYCCHSDVIYSCGRARKLRWCVDVVVVYCVGVQHSIFVLFGVDMKKLRITLITTAVSYLENKLII